jgi:hypothetical protein
MRLFNFIKPSPSFLIGYLVVFFILAGSGLVGLRWYYQQNFSPAKLETMLTTRSIYRDTTTDPCKYAVYGDPVMAGTRYVKIQFFCTPEKKTASTLSLRAIKSNNFTAIIRMYAYLIGFDPAIILNPNGPWRCRSGPKMVTDYSMTILDSATIECRNTQNIPFPTP